MAGARTSTLAEQLGDAVTALWALLLQGTPRDRSRTALSVLHTLRTEGPQRVTALAVREAVAQPTMTTLVDRLERDGLVARRPDPADGRATLVAVTPDGEALLRDRHDRRARFLAARLELLDPAERDAIAAALPALEHLTAPPEDAS